MDAEQRRSEGVVVDLEKLERHARDLYLHRFVEAVRKARQENGQYLTLRPGDELAIQAADDGSAASLDDVMVPLETDQ